jgi:hypothetical protein
MYTPIGEIGLLPSMTVTSFCFTVQEQNAAMVAASTRFLITFMFSIFLFMGLIAPVRVQ